MYVEFEISLTKDVSLRSIGKIKIYHACVVKKMEYTYVTKTLD